MQKLARLFVPAATAAGLIAVTASMPAHAQSIQSPETVDAVVGAQIDTETTEESNVQEQLHEAIENMVAATDAVRMTTVLDNMRVVFVGGEIPEELDAPGQSVATQLQALRDALSGNAIFAYGLESRSVQVGDIIAVSFSDNRRSVIIYSLGEEPEARVSDPIQGSIASDPQSNGGSGTEGSTGGEGANGAAGQN